MNRTIITDNWAGPKSTNREAPWLTVEQAVAAVNALDGATRTQVVLKIGNRSLIIGGGNEGQFSVVLTVGEDEQFFTLTDSTISSNDETTIVTGGQAGRFPRNQAIKLAAAITAVKSFFESGQPAASLTWQRD